MQRDLDLIRTVLIELESSTRAISGHSMAAVLKGKPINPHHWLHNAYLIVDGGLAEGEVIKDEHDHYLQSISLYRLTWKGSDFLNLIRDEKDWKLVTMAFGTVDLSFDLFQEAFMVLKRRQIEYGLGPDDDE